MPVSDRFGGFPHTARFLVCRPVARLPHARILKAIPPLSAEDSEHSGFSISIAGATGSSSGVVRLAGQLGGTASSPAVVGLTGIDASSAPLALSAGTFRDGEALVRSGTELTTSPFPTASSFNHNSLQGLSTGNPHTQYQQVSEKGQNGGYAGIDTNGFLSVPARTIRNASDPSTPSAGEIWVNGGEFRFNDGAATRAAVPTSRQVLPGGGLTGGGALTADVTLNIAAFTGLVSKDVDPASQTYAASSVTTVLTVDVGADGELTPIAIRLPATTDSNLQTGVIFEFAGSGSVAVFNSSTTNVLDSQFQALMLVLMGDLTVGPANNGKRLQRIRLQIKNTSGSTAVTTDIGVFRLRAIAGPRGAGSAL